MYFYGVFSVYIPRMWVDLTLKVNILIDIDLRSRRMNFSTNCFVHYFRVTIVFLTFCVCGYKPNVKKIWLVSSVDAILKIIKV